MAHEDIPLTSVSIQRESKRRQEEFSREEERERKRRQANDLYEWRRLKFPGILFGRDDPEYRQKETIYRNIRDHADRLMESCRMVGIGVPRRVNLNEGKITRRNIDDCIGRLRTGIDVMQRRCDDYMNLDPDKQPIEDNDSDYDADMRALYVAIEKANEEAREMRAMEEDKKMRVNAERLLYGMSLKKCWDRLNQPLVTRSPRSTSGLPVPQVYWNLYETKKCDSSFNMMIPIRFFGNELKLSFKGIQSLSSGQCLDNEIVGLYIELLRRWYNVETRNIPRHKRFAVMQCLNFADILKNDEERFGEATKVLMDLPGEQHPAKCKSMLIPIQVAGYHWVLGMFDINRKKVVIYDSLGCKEPSAEQMVIEEMLPILVSQWDPDWIQDRAEASWRRVYSTVERQPDGCSSGIYMLACFDMILRGYSPSGISIASSLQDARECIAEDFLVCGIKMKEFLEAYPEFKKHPQA